MKIFLKTHDFHHLNVYIYLINRILGVLASGNASMRLFISFLFMLRSFRQSVENNLSTVKTSNRTALLFVQSKCSPGEVIWRPFKLNSAQMKQFDIRSN